MSLTKEELNKMLGQRPPSKKKVEEMLKYLEECKIDEQDIENIRIQFDAIEAHCTLGRPVPTSLAKENIFVRFCKNLFRGFKSRRRGWSMDINTAMNDLSPVSTSKFEVGEIAYVIPYWHEFGLHNRRVYTVKILDVGKTKVKTTEIPKSLKNTGVSDRRKTLEFKISKRSIYCESWRDEERAKLNGQLLSNLTLELQKQYSSSTVLLPSIEYLYAFSRGLGVKSFIIEDKTYEVN